MINRDRNKIIRDVGAIASTVDEWMGCGKSKWNVEPISKVYSELITEIILKHSEHYRVNTIRSMISESIEAISPIHSTILNIIGHGHPILKELRLSSENMFGQNSLVGMDWARYIFPKSMGVVEEQIKENGNIRKGMFMGVSFRIFIEKFIETLYDDYRETLYNYGRLDNLSTRFINKFRLCEVPNITEKTIFYDLFMCMKVDIVRIFIENVDANDIDTLVENIAELIKAEETQFITDPDIFKSMSMFVEIFVYSLFKDPSTTYSIIYQYTTGSSLDECVANMNEILDKYKVVEKHLFCSTALLTRINVIIDLIMDYLTEVEITDVMEFRARVDIFNEVINRFIEFKYFIDAEILAGSISEPTEKVEDKRPLDESILEVE